MLQRAPLVPVALLGMVGIVLGRYLELPVGGWAFLAALGMAGAVILAAVPRWHGAGCVAAGAAVLGLAAVHASLAHQHIARDDIVTCVGPAPILATVRGRVASFPVLRSSVLDGEWAYYRPPRTEFLLDCESVRGRDGSYLPARGQARVVVQEPLRTLVPGQRVELCSWLRRFEGPDNPGEFDWRAHEHMQHRYVRLSVPGVEGVTVLDGGAMPPLVRWYWRVRTGARDALTPGAEDAPGASLVAALVIGQRSDAIDALNRTMVRGGTAHLLSISGMHLGIFLMFVYGLCRALGLPPRRCALLVLGVLALYVLTASPRAPLLRSAVMAAAVCLSVLLRRRHSPLNALAAAALVLLALDPLQLFQAGFQLSFAIVAGLLVLYEPLRRRLFGRYLHHRGLLAFRDDERVRRWIHSTAANFAIASVTASLAAYLVSVPLVAYHFGLFSPYAAGLSLLLLPLVTLTLIPGYLALGLQMGAPNLAWQCSRVSAAMADLTGRTVALTEYLPHLCIELRPLPPLWALGCYLVLGAVVARRHVPFARPLIAAAVVVLAGGTVYTQLPAPAPPDAELHLLDVGAGQCALLRAPSGASCFLDAGSQTHPQTYERIVAPFLRARSLPHPDVAFVSHANTDHYSALRPAIEAGRLRRVYLNDRFGRVERDTTDADRAFLALLADGGVEVVRLRAGDRVPLDDRTCVEVLAPSPDLPESADVNDTSLVLRVVCDGRGVLLPGDAEALAQGRLLAAATPLRSDVLVLPHHGGWMDTLPDFVAAVAPEVVLVSGMHDPRPPARAPRPAREFYAHLPTRFRYHTTRTNGYILLRFGRHGVTVETMH